MSTSKCTQVVVIIVYRLFWSCDFELCEMVKRKYPGLIVFSVETIISILLCPTLWSVASKYLSIVSLNNGQCGSFVETVLVPWFLRELVLSALVNPVQLCKFLAKALHKECFMLAHVDQTFWGTHWEWWHFHRYLCRLRLWWLLKRPWLCFLFPQEIVFLGILFLFLFMVQVPAEKIKLLQYWNEI
jgi:hypothetical protein